MKGRCYGLCGRGKKDDGNTKKVSMLERDMLTYQHEMETLERTKKILREDIYQNLTKLFFQLGYDYKDFSRMFFEKNYYEEVMQEETKTDGKNYNWCERNLMFKDPINNRFLFLWDILFLVSFTVEIYLVPYIIGSTILVNNEEDIK